MNMAILVKTISERSNEKFQTNNWTREAEITSLK